MKTEIKHDGCKPQVVKTLGCAGYCKSEASLLLGKDILINKCKSCRPVGLITFHVELECLNGKKWVEPILAATSCHCERCSAPIGRR